MKKTAFTYILDNIDIETEKALPEMLNDKKGNFVKNIHTKDLLPNSLFFAAVEQVPIAISITDKKAKILYANQEFCKITGYTLDEVIGQNESILSNKSTPREVYYDLWHTISRHSTWHGQLINRHKKGHPYLADLTISPIQDKLKNTTHYIGMHRNISEPYEIKKNLNNQKLLVESVINASSVAMVVLDQNNRVILDNLQYKTLISDLGHTEPVHLFLELLTLELGDIRAYLSTHANGFSNIEIRIDSHLNPVPAWFSCSGNLFQEQVANANHFFDDKTLDFLLLSFSNITVQRRHHEESYLQSLKVLLAEEEQVRSIRETLLGSIHQINQPLNQIQAAIQLMHTKKQTGALLDLLQQLEDSCQQTVDTLQQCVPEIFPTAITAININQILHQILMLSNDTFLRNGIIIDWEPSVILPHIMGAENKLLTLFKKLIDNAIYALSRNKNTERCIKITTSNSHQRVSVSIADTGPGIPAHLHSKIFQPFFTTKDRGDAQVGMGLVVAKDIVNQFNGNIELDADYQNGCRFIVSFPVISRNNTGYDQ